MCGTDTFNALSRFIDIRGILNKYEFGIGYKSELSNSTTFFTQVVYVKVEADLEVGGYPFASAEDNSYQLSFGVRNSTFKNLELSAAIKYDDNDQLSDKLYTELGATYNFTDTVGLYFNIDTDFDFSMYGVGLRVSF